MSASNFSKNNSDDGPHSSISEFKERCYTFTWTINNFYIFCNNYSTAKSISSPEFNAFGKQWLAHFHNETGFPLKGLTLDLKLSKMAERTFRNYIEFDGRVLIKLIGENDEIIYTENKSIDHKIGSFSPVASFSFAKFKEKISEITEKSSNLKIEFNLFEFMEISHKDTEAEAGVDSKNEKMDKNHYLTLSA